ncbi:succinate dehydrogenase, cytochrome b556 subunit [Acidimicrobiaceae bacterium]|jgi:succinate dehydrogenase / fumarate reductase cytochrome b subunit|nr:succinate dehydrogenase, cytochrome b556 subunit [Acidimicrobiaceae bacterium]|tara:strand:- start:1121 stop:1582 length:462 start_codon:yes stop_codon:yes gene_type:complete
MAYQRIVSTGSIYKGKTGMWLYIFHRVTGVGLFGYLLLHIISTALILLGPEIYEGAEAIYKNFYFRVAEIGLMAAVLGHAINGLRIIAVDLWAKGSDYQKQLNFASLFVFLIIFVPTTYKMTTSYFDLCLEKSSEGTTIVDCMIRPIPDWKTK